MKIFDYKCSSCEDTFESLAQPDDEVIHCQKCNVPAEKVFSFAPTQKPDPKMAEYSIKFRKSINKYKNTPKDQRPYVK